MFTTTHYNMVDLLIHNNLNFWKAAVASAREEISPWQQETLNGMQPYMRRIYELCAMWAVENDYRVSDFI